MAGATIVPGKVGRAFNFDGSGQKVTVPDYEDLKLTNSLTIEGWVFVRGPGFLLFRGDSRPGLDPYSLTIESSGVLQILIVDASNNYVILQSPTTVPTSQWKHVAATLEASSGTLSLFIDGAMVAQTITAIRPLYELDPNYGPGLGIGGHSGDYGYFPFNGMIDEISLYSRALSPGEIQAIYNAGSGGKCVAPSAPFIINQPANQTVTVGGTAAFGVLAGGTAPLNYQWTFQGTNLDGATSSSLVLNNVQFSQTGAYSVLVSNALGSTTSSSASLSVNFPPAVVRLVGGTNMGGANISVPVVLSANGNENALGFSIKFDPALLAFSDVELGSGAANATLLVNSNQALTGTIGVALALPPDQTLSAGDHELVQVSFVSSVVTNTTSTTVGFSDSPIRRELSDPPGNTLPATYLAGIVALSPTDFEADVSPRPNGNRAVTITDWVLIGRYAARLDYPTNSSEFQRADCAPRSTLGNGAITVSDWVQAGRYAAGLDPLTLVGGPDAETPLIRTPVASGGTQEPRPAYIRQVQVTNASLIQGQTGGVSINLQALGDENAISFSLAFDASQFTYVSASLGSGASGATLNLNTAKTSSGLLACVLALPPGSSFPAGVNELVRVNLRAASSATGAYPISLLDQPVQRETSNPTADTLATVYVNGSLTVKALPALRILRTSAGITLAWPESAAGFNLQETVNFLPGAIWSNLSVPPSVTNGENQVTLPLASGTRFYRLSSQ